MITEAMGIQPELVFQETVMTIAKMLVKLRQLEKNHQMVIAGGDSLKFGAVLLPFMGMISSSAKPLQLIQNNDLYTAQVIGHWYPFSLVVVLLNVVFIFCHPYLPESPRWLITQKRFSEAADLINDIR